MKLRARASSHAATEQARWGVIAGRRLPRRFATGGTALALIALLTACSGRSKAPLPSADVVGFLSAPAEAGFERIEGPPGIRFPADAGPHPDYQTEWWYYTGNMAALDESGAETERRFGFQFTVFRRALVAPPERAERDSGWAADQLYLAHFALTDVEAGLFTESQRLARGALDLAGARSAPFEAWVEDWRVETLGDSPGPQGLDEPGPAVRILAQEGEVGIDLVLEPTKPPALHGDAGYSQKGPENGNASAYYSHSRMDLSGQVSTLEGRFEVGGLAWMDHEWSTSALSQDQVGWDWFSVQLDDGQELMAYQLRLSDGSPDFDWGGGSLIDAQGQTTKLSARDMQLTVLNTWTSPDSGDRYPSDWRLELPDYGLDLRLEPLQADQELDLGLRYWEGAIAISGQRDGRPISGRGYAELTGYAGGGGLPGLGR